MLLIETVSVENETKHDENSRRKGFVDERNVDSGELTNEHDGSDVSKVKSKRNCWMSDSHKQNVDVTSTTTTTRAPKKVNFRSIEEVKVLEKLIYVSKYRNYKIKRNV